MDFESEIRRLQDTLTVVAEIQRRQAEVQRMSAEEVALHADRLREHEQRMREHQERMTHIELTLAEIGDKLNALIDIVDGLGRKPKQ